MDYNIEDEVFFIDENGNKISNEKIASHIGLAMNLLEKNEKLKKEFEESGKNDPTEFLISDKGYLAGGTMRVYKSITYKSNLISDKQRRLLQYYCEEGYKLNDVVKQKGRDEGR